MTTILCYGDSNTYGTAPMETLLSDHRFADRWPRVMAGALGPGHTVIEEGLPGRTMAHDDPVDGAHLNGLSVLPAVLMSHRPDLLILKLGTNDTKARFNLTGADIAVGVRNLALRARSFLPDLKILVVCPPPPIETGCLAEFFAGAEARAAVMPRWFSYFADECGCAFFDAGTIIASDPLDGIHYSEAAHRTLGWALADQVREALQS